MQKKFLNNKNQQQLKSIHSKSTLNFITIFTISIWLLSWISIKICLPALPSLAAVFSTSDYYLKLSVTVYLLCFGLSQPLWGSASEYLGRKRILLLALGISVIGSVITMLSHEVLQFIIGRSIEGIGMGAISPICRAIYVDIFDKKQMSKAISSVSSATAMMPALAPILGGYMLVYIGWRSIFVFLAMLALLFYVVGLFYLPETHQRLNRAKFSISHIVSTYSEIITNKKFWSYGLCYAAMTGGMLGYYAAMPYWFVKQFHIAENHYAYLALFSVTAYIITLVLMRSLVNRFSSNKLLFIGVLLTISLAVFAIISAMTLPSTVTTVVLLISLFTFCTGFVFPNANVGVMSTFKHAAGPASALSVTLVFLAAAFFSLIAMNLSMQSLWPVALYISGIAVMSLIAYLL